MCYLLLFCITSLQVMIFVAGLEMTYSTRLIVPSLHFKSNSRQRHSSKAVKGLSDSGSKDEGKRQLVAKLSELDGNYPGGLPEYIRNSKKLLKDAQDGKGAKFFVSQQTLLCSSGISRSSMSKKD